MVERALKREHKTTSMVGMADYVMPFHTDQKRNTLIHHYLAPRRVTRTVHMAGLLVQSGKLAWKLARI